MKPGPLFKCRLTWFLAAPALLLTAVLISSWIRVRFDPDRLWREAEAALRGGDPQSAAANLTWIHRIRSPNSRDWMLEAQIAIANGQTEQALAALGSIGSGDSLASQAFLLAGRVERQRNRLHSAEIQFRRALEVDPNLVDAHRELVYIYGIQSRRPEVDAEFRTLARLTILTRHDLFTWAFTQFSPHRPDDAKVLKAFVDAEPNDRYSRLSLAEMISSEGGSQAELERLLDGLPESDPDVLATRARIAFTRGHTHEAEAVLAQGPSNHVALDRLRGKLAVYRQDYDSAVTYYRRAQGLEPYDRMTTLELGQALALKGEKQAAAIFLERAKQLSEVYNLINRIGSAERENEGPDLIKVATAFEKAGLFPEASHWFELAVNRNPLDVEAGRGLRRVRDLATRAASLSPIDSKGNRPGG